MPRGFCVHCNRYRYINSLEMCPACTQELIGRKRIPIEGGREHPSNKKIQEIIVRNP